MVQPPEPPVSKPPEPPPPTTVTTTVAPPEITALAVQVASLSADLGLLKSRLLDEPAALRAYTTPHGSPPTFPATGGPHSFTPTTAILQPPPGYENFRQSLGLPPGPALLRAPYTPLPSLPYLHYPTHSTPTNRPRLAHPRWSIAPARSHRLAHYIAIRRRSNRRLAGALRCFDPISALLPQTTPHIAFAWIHPDSMARTPKIGFSIFTTTSITWALPRSSVSNSSSPCSILRQQIGFGTTARATHPYPGSSSLTTFASDSIRITTRTTWASCPNSLKRAPSRSIKRPSRHYRTMSPAYRKHRS